MAEPGYPQRAFPAPALQASATGGISRASAAFWSCWRRVAGIPTPGSTRRRPQGWPAQYGDAANSSYTPTAGADRLTLQWTPFGEGQSLSVGSAGRLSDWLAVNAQTAAGCSLMEWENDDNGRQRWCTRLVQGGGFAGPLFDGFDNLYVGQPGAMLSFPPTQWIRWRHPVIGMPSTPRFLGGGQLLVVTHLGQVQVFDSHRGDRRRQSRSTWWTASTPPTPTRGLSDCRRPGPAARSPPRPPSRQRTGMIVVGVWEPERPRGQRWSG